LTPIWFEELGLPSQVLAGLRDAGFTSCTPLQVQAIPIALEGRDVAAQAVTGTGKVTAYLVPLLAWLLNHPEREKGLTTGLVLSPTPALAEQVYQDALVLGRHTGLTLSLAGLSDSGGQAGSSSESPQILIGTPALITEKIKQGDFKAGNVRFLALDEVNRLFDMGLMREMRYILRKLPHHERRTTMIFSTALSHRLVALFYHYLTMPEFVYGVTEAEQLQGLEHSLIHVGSDEKASLLLGLLKRESWNRVLVFVNTWETADRLTRILKGNGFPAEGVTADMPLRKRLRLMAWVKRGPGKILVATDASIGAVHVEDVTHVIQYDLPQEPRGYIRRMARIAGVAAPVRAIALACEEYVFHLESIEEILGGKIPVLWPEPDWFLEDRSSAGPATPEPSQELAPKEEETSREKRSFRGKGGAKIVFSTEPGGVFGLAPVRTAQPERPSGGKKKPKRRRTKRGSKPEHHQGPAGGEPTEKSSTE